MPSMPRPLKAKKIALKIMKKYTDIDDQDKSMEKTGSKPQDIITKVPFNPSVAGYVR